MFERYTEPARRVLFFSRFETSATGARAIESEHLLLGLLRESGPIVRHIFAAAGVSRATLREEIESKIALREKFPTSVEIPFSEQTKHILQYTAEEADNLRHSYIGPEHMLLALLRMPESTAGAILAGHGLRLQATREAVVTLIAESAASTPQRSADSDAPEAAVLRVDARVDTDEILSDIDRIHRIVGQLGAKLPTPPPNDALELLHLLQIEVLSLRNRFS